jgi:hypothetical protein
VTLPCDHFLQTVLSHLDQYRQIDHSKDRNKSYLLLGIADDPLHLRQGRHVRVFFSDVGDQQGKL